MNPIEEIKKEHEKIEEEILQLNAVMEEEVINYPALIHSFKKLCEMWDEHERKEEKIFKFMKRKGIRFPVYTMTCEHRNLRGHISKIKDAINSGSEIKTKKCLDNDLRILIRKIKEHKDKEDEILYSLNSAEFEAKI